MKSYELLSHITDRVLSHKRDEFSLIMIVTSNYIYKDRSLIDNLLTVRNIADIHRVFGVGPPAAVTAAGTVLGR